MSARGLMVLAAFLLAVGSSVQALSLDLATGAEKRLESAPEAGSVPVATGPWRAGDGVPTITPEGAVQRTIFRIHAPGASTQILLDPLRQQLEASGFEVLFSCETEGCGGFDFRFALDVAPPPEMYVALGDFRYLSARSKKGAAYVTLLVSRTEEAGYIEITRFGVDDALETTSARGGAITTPVTDNLGARLEAEGHVVLSDLSFGSGSARLGEGPFDTLAALAGYLEGAPGRRVALVGHTDTEGGFEPNVALSRRRAASVRERLISDYGVPASRLDAEGMGYLAPVASNLDAAGREANRRVEAVLLP